MIVNYIIKFLLKMYRILEVTNKTPENQGIVILGKEDPFAKILTEKNRTKSYMVGTGARIYRLKTVVILHRPCLVSEWKTMIASLDCLNKNDIHRCDVIGRTPL
jgi:hypothetical protein